MEKPSLFWRRNSANHNQSHPNLCWKKSKNIPFLAQSCRLLIGWYNQLKVHFWSQFLHFRSTLILHLFLSLEKWYWVVSRLWTRFSYSDCRKFCQRNDSQFSKNLFGSVELLWSQRHDFLINHPAWTLITPNQQRTPEMRDEKLSEVGAQDMKTNGYQVLDLDVGGFFLRKRSVWGRLCLQTRNWYPLSLGDWKISKDSILLDQDLEKEISPPITPVTERPTRPLVLMEMRPFGRRIANALDYVYRSLFQ